MTGWPANQPALLALGTMHGFTLDHLAANRAGRLHPEQIAAGVKAGRGDVRFGVVMFVIGALLFFAGLATAVFPRAVKDLDFRFAMPTTMNPVFVGMFLGLLVGAVPCLLGVLASRHGRGVVAAYGRGKAAVVIGPLQRLRIGSRHGSGCCYYVVGNLRLAVARSAWRTMPDGGVYRVHYEPDTLRVLSLEPADAQARPST